MEKTIERLVNGNIKVTIPIRLKYDGCKTIIRQPEAEVTELDPETMSPLQKAVIQGFQYRDMLESGKVATVSELAQKVKQERAFLFRALSLVNLAPDIIEAILNGNAPPLLHYPNFAKASPKTGPSSENGLGWSKKSSALMHIMVSAEHYAYLHD